MKRAVISCYNILPRINESSYRKISGTASKNWDITSGGVINAASTKKVTIKWLLNSDNCSVVANSSLSNSMIIRGNWKLTPSANVSKNTK